MDSSQQDVDEQFRALMEGLRTTLPGVAVLFAFLLTLPLSGPFTDLSDPEVTIYYVAFIGAMLSLVLLIAPSVHQRLRAPASEIARRHADHVRTAVRLTNVGTVCLAVTIVASVYLVTSIIVGGLLAGVATGLAVVAVAVTWYYFPLVAWSDD